MNTTLLGIMAAVWVATGIGAYIYSQQREKAQEQNPIEPQQPTAPVSSIADELAKLKELHEKGAINEVEFETLKAKIIRGSL